MESFCGEALATYKRGEALWALFPPYHSVTHLYLTHTHGRQANALDWIYMLLALSTNLVSKDQSVLLEQCIVVVS